MQEEIVFIGTSDLSAHFRGKSFPATELPSKLRRGVGLAPTNLYMGAFGPIQTTTFGTRGEVFLIPDESTRVHFLGDGRPGEHFYLPGIIVRAAHCGGRLTILPEKPAGSCTRPSNRNSPTAASTPFHRVLMNWMVCAASGLLAQTSCRCCAAPVSRRTRFSQNLGPSSLK